MSRQSKKSKAARNAKASKATGREHFAPDQTRPRFPHQQPAPIWIKPTGAKGWWNTPKKQSKLGKSANDSHHQHAA